MVSKARDDLPEPERPVTTVRVLRGMETETSRRLCWRAPRTLMCVSVRRAARGSVTVGEEVKADKLLGYSGSGVD